MISLFILFITMFYTFMFKVFMFICRHKLYYFTFFYPFCTTSVIMFMAYNAKLKLPQFVVVILSVLIVLAYIYIAYFLRKKTFQWQRKRKIKKQQKEIMEYFKLQEEHTQQ